jgi:hypothetical protein
VSISKPIWYYGLEAMEAQLLPPKGTRLRRIAFAHLALPGLKEAEVADRPPDDELARLSRAIPLWFAETFYFAPSYAPVAALGLITPPQGTPGPSRHALFGGEWTPENFRQLVETSGDGLDYIVSGALRAVAGDYEIVLRIWEVKTFRERKSFQARWTPATVDAALLQLHAQVRSYMEWSPASAAFAYTVPTEPRGWLDTLGASVGLFLVEKGLLPADQIRTPAADVREAAQRGAMNEAASLAFLTLQARAKKLGHTEPVAATLARSPLVLQAQKTLG